MVYRRQLLTNNMVYRTSSGFALAMSLVIDDYELSNKVVIDNYESHDEVVIDDYESHDKALAFRGCYVARLR